MADPRSVLLALCLLPFPLRSPSDGADPATPPAIAAAAQEPQSVEEYREDVLRILRAGMTSGRTYAKLSELVEVAPHRLSGSPGAAAAVEWARQAMLRDGLENVRLEECTVPHWVRGDVQMLRIVEPAGLAGTELPILALGGSVATPEHGLTAEVVRVESFEGLRQLGNGARGKIVLFDRPMDSALFDTFDAYGRAVDQRTSGASEAAKAGAVAAIVRSMTTRKDDFPHTGAMRYSGDAPRIPACAVSTNGADKLASLLRQGESVRVHLRMNCRTLEDAPSHNVVGELVGREAPEEILVVGGHLDAWDVGQGAHDDGGGCCQAIEAVRLLSSLDLRPRRTIRVVLFMNEENGLNGARAYYEAHAEEMARHVLAIESDRGSYSPRGFTTDAQGAALATLQSIGALLAPLGADRIVPGGGGADISPMRASGVPLMGLLPDGHRYFDLHHSARDTMAEISPRELEAGTACMAAMLYVVAELPEPLPRNTPQ